MSAQSMKVDAVLHWKHFRRYFSDAAFFAYDASAMQINDGKDQQRQKAYTRSAIVFSALALESAANCCLDFLGLQKGAFEDFEKLQTLSKFDLFLRDGQRKDALDREHKLVHPIRNLISCRNAIVHSKVQTDRVKEGRVEPQIWEPLGLPHNPEYWQPVHAIKCFTVMSDFLNYFFFEACRVPLEGRKGRSWVAQILGSVVAQDGEKRLPGDVKYGPVQDNSMVLWKDAARAWDLEFAFFGTYTTSGTDNRQVYPKRKWGDYSHCRVGDLAIPWQPVCYLVPRGLGIIMVGKPDKQSAKKKGT
jgi:hypothetical protein